MDYYEELCEAMRLLSEQPNAIFLGQGVAVKGTTMSSTFEHVPPDQLLEMPVAEDMQMGMATGMALSGLLPICVFPRWNFLICAMNQIVNHLDRLPLYSDGGYQPKVIIRVATPSRVPFNPGPQHDDNFSIPLEGMLRTIRVIRATKSPLSAYREAIETPESSIVVEYTDFYRNARATE